MNIYNELKQMPRISPFQPVGYHIALHHQQEVNIPPGGIVDHRCTSYGIPYIGVTKGLDKQLVKNNLAIVSFRSWWSLTP
ncbi:MAG: hypothetical protein BWX52_01054 [Bacteroidetes bacterium ADurb.Bin013]|nr:MAG: hypothetical protein BWX52_01054 [Bacteroidetes bacterium ADurb.Bin013]